MSKHRKRGGAGGGEPKPKAFDGFRSLAGLKEIKESMSAAAAAEPREEALRRTAAAAEAAKEAARAKERAAASSDDDDLSFHRMMSGVVPMQESARRVPVSAAAGIERRLAPDSVRATSAVRSERDEALEQLHRLVEEGVRFEVSDDGSHLEGRRADVPPQLLRALRRGALPVDSRLDLHGMKAEEARAAVEAWLSSMRQRGDRCGLLICGKGLHSPGGVGVLRGEVGAWLSQGRAREHVAAFATAHDDDGGRGAVYVALRRGA